MHYLLFSFFIFIFGLITGSFLNCLIYRISQEKSFVSGRSFCPKCKHTLSWRDLIPLASFIFLKGKCRYCSDKISMQYPIVELVTGLLFLLIFNFQFSIFNQILMIKFSNIIQFCYLLFIAACLIAIFVYDLKHYIIPDKIIFPAIIITFLYQVFGNWNHILLPLLAGALAGGFFFIIWLISSGKWMGFGDVKLAVFMGLFLGWPNILVALFFAFSIGAIIGLILFSLKRKGWKSEIPFGPFLIIGTCIAFVAGDKLFSWYFNLAF